MKKMLVDKGFEKYLGQPVGSEQWIHDIPERRK